MISNWIILSNLSEVYFLKYSTHNKCDPNQPIIFRKLNCFYSLLLHIVEGMMNETKLIHNDKNDHTVPVEIVAKDNKNNMAKIQINSKIIENTFRRSERGARIKISATKLL